MTEDSSDEPARADEKASGGSSESASIPPRPRPVTRWRRAAARGKAIWRRMSKRPGVAHLVRAVQRTNDRMASQFAAAITYFSFLSLVPILMVAFSVAGFVLSSRPDLLADLKTEVTAIIPAGLGDQSGGLIDQAVAQRVAVGIVGLVVALYSGLNWMGNVRDAVRAQWRPQWERPAEQRGNIVLRYLWDLVSLAGLAVAVLITFALTATGTAAQDLVVRWLGLGDLHWMSPLLHVGPFVVAIAADMLIFGWLYAALPYREYRADRRTLLIGSLAMAVCFEILKAALTILVSRSSSSPTAAVFGSVIGLLLFFNLVARAFLTIAAWLATAERDTARTSASEVGPAR